MKNILYLVWLLTVSITYAQDPTIEWERFIGGTATDFSSSIEQTVDGGYIVGGGTYSNDGDVTGHHGGSDVWVVKLDDTGNIQWQKALGGSNDEWAREIQQTTDGGFIVSGSTTSNDGDVTGHHGGYDFWVVKLDDTGSIQWQKSLGGSNTDFGESIQQTTDGGFIVAGSSNSNNGDVTGNHGGYDFWVVKLDDTGNIQWQKSLGGSANDRAYGIQQTTDGGFIVAGSSYSNNGDVHGHKGNGDFWVVKLNDTGTIQWEETLGGSSVDEARCVRQTSDGGFIVAGYTNSYDGDVQGHQSNGDCWVVKLSLVGEIEWENSYGHIIVWLQRVFSIRQTSDNGYIFVYGSVERVEDWNFSFVMKIDQNGGFQWQLSSGLEDSFNNGDVNLTTDGGFIACGSSSQQPYTAYDFLVFKISAVPPGCPDADGDGVCDDDDVCPGFDDNLIGDSCDDGDPCTENDVFTINCICEGAAISGCGCTEVTDNFSPNPLTHVGPGSSNSNVTLAENNTEVAFTISGLGSRTNGNPNNRYIERVTVNYINGSGTTVLYGVFRGDQVSTVNVSIAEEVQSVTLTLDDAYDGNSSTQMSVSMTPVTSCANGGGALIDDSGFQSGVQVAGEVILYPNPTNGDLFVQWEKAPAHATIRVYNAIGQSVGAVEVEEVKVARISLTSYGISGSQMLFVSIEADGHRYGMRKVIVKQ